MRRMSPLACYVRARLHRRIFLWFGATIVLTAIVVGAIAFGFGGRDRAWSRDVQRVAAFASGRFARVWDDPPARDELARSMADTLDLDVTLLDARGAVLARFGAAGACRHPWRLPIDRDGEALGAAEVCAERHHAFAFGPRVFLAIAAAAALLSAASRKIARRLSRPIVEVAGAAEQIGAGNFAARVRIPPRRGGGEIDVLATSINTMAERIEKQFRDQKALLAAVSHEIRTPLARVRLLLELLREKGIDEKELAEIDREAVEMDALVAELLASSRIEFSALSSATIDGADHARRALERAGVASEKVVVEGTDTELACDPTLLARAIANLVANAARHGGGLSALRVRGAATVVAFVAEDRGPGFADGEEERAFEAFFRGARATNDDASLGLGLALVRRIAEAHGGRVWAKNREGGGAEVGIELPRAAVTAS